jgi:hypothetical protein
MHAFLHAITNPGIPYHKHSIFLTCIECPQTHQPLLPGSLKPHVGQMQVLLSARLVHAIHRLQTGCSIEILQYTFTSGITAGAVMFLRPRKKCISFAAFSASSRKSSSRARFRLRSSRTHPNSKDLGNSQAATVDSADSVAMSAATAASRPKYCTLTATCRPSCRRALCTCNHSLCYSFIHIHSH